MSKGLASYTSSSNLFESLSHWRHLPLFTGTRGATASVSANTRSRRTSRLPLRSTSGASCASTRSTTS